MNRNLPGVDITIERGLGFKRVVPLRVGALVPKDVSLTLLKSWKEAKENIADGELLKLLYDFFLNGGGEILLHGYSVGADWSATAGNILSAASDLLTWRDEFGEGIEFYILPISLSSVQPSDTEYADLVRAIGNLNDTAWQDEQYPVFTLMDARKKGDSESISAYVGALSSMGASLLSSWSSSARVAIFLSYSRMMNEDGSAEERTALFAIAGRLNSAPFHHSIAWVERMSISNALEILPKTSDTDRLDEDRIASLDESHINALRLFPGYGILPHYDWMIARPDDDYQNIRYRRIMDEAIRRVKRAFIPFINSPGVDAASLQVLKAALERPLDEITASPDNPDAPIHAYRLQLEPDPEVLLNGIIHAQLDIVPTGSKRTLKGVFKLVKEIK